MSLIAQQLLTEFGLFESQLSLVASTWKRYCYHLCVQLLTPFGLITVQIFRNCISVLFYNKNNNKVCEMSCACKLSFRVAFDALCVCP
jgi:hypothetical protein